MIRLIKYILGLAFVFVLSYPIYWAFTNTKYDFSLPLVFYVVLSIFSNVYINYNGSNLNYRINGFIDKVTYSIPKAVVAIYNFIPILWLAFLVPMWLYIFAFGANIFLKICKIFIMPIIVFFSIHNNF